MKKKVRKIWILLLLLILMWSISGCNKAEERVEQEEVQLTEEPIQNTQKPEVTLEPKVPEITSQPELPENYSESEKQEILTSENIITYGDKIRISYSKITQEYQWEYTGMQEFQVSSTSEQFQNEFNDSEEAAMMQVEEAIGKTVGDTFILWYEGGDALYGYEYTIIEVKSQNPDIVEYGDKILADYSMTHYGVDTCEGEKIHTGQLDLHLINTNAFFAIDEDGCCSSRQGDMELKKILGKTIGDQFESGNDYYENSFSYQFTIKDIKKAVKHGDTIVAEVREANTLDVKCYEEHSEAELVLDLDAMEEFVLLDGESMTLDNIRICYKELIGKKAGDRAVFIREDREKREIYQIMIQSVTAYESEDSEDMEALLMAEKSEMLMFYEYFSEYREFFPEYRELYGYDPETYSEPVLSYIVIYDRNKQMVYEYSTYIYDGYISCNMSDKYEYTTEYDEKGRLMKETICGSEWHYDIVYEYKYNEQGNCIEIIKCTSAFEMHYYYDDMGNEMKTEYF